MENKKTYSIRHATEDDVFDVLFLGKKFVKESGNSKLGWSTDKVQNVFLEAVNREDFLILVLEQDEEIVGMFIAFLAPCFFSDEIQGAELAWYVLPDHRKTRKSFEMLRLYEDWCKEKSAVQATLVNLDVLNAQKVAKLYTKRGYKITENTFIKELR